MESFIQEMKRYLGFTEEDAALLRQLGPRMEKYLPELAERFYSQIPHHPNAFRVFTGGEEQIARLKDTLQVWARGLFRGEYDEAYAEERYRILAGNVVDVVTAQDAAGVITWVSPSVTWTLGWERPDVVGRPMADLVHQDDRAALARAHEALAGHEAGVARLRAVTRRGGDVPVRLVLRAVLDEDDRVVGSEAGWHPLDR